MKLDGDVSQMSFGERGKELQRLRALIRTHKRKRGHARCWKNDADLYKRALPEGDGGAGRMDLPKKVLLRACEHYIDGQQQGLTILDQES